MTLNDLVKKLSADLDPKQATALRAVAERLSKMDALAARRTVTAFMDDAALVELGVEDPAVAALARQLATARTMEIDGELIDDAQADPNAATRALIAQLTAAGDSATADRLTAGLNEVLAQTKEDQP